MNHADRTPQLLLIAEERELLAELETALQACRRPCLVVDATEDTSRGVELAVNLQPDIVMLQMPADEATLRTVAEEIQHGAPSTILVGILDDSGRLDERDERDFLIAAMRSGVEDFVRRPLSPVELDEVMARRFGAAAQASAPSLPGDRGRVVTFISNKGGVGKTTLAVNTAALAAQQNPDRVLLVDASLQLGLCASLLDLPAEPTLADAARSLDRLDGTLLQEYVSRHPCGLHLLAAPSDAVDAADVDADSLARILSVARRSYDLIVVDTFPLLDAVALAVLDRAERCYVVVANSVPTVHGTQRLLDVLDQLQVPRSQQRIVLNSPQPDHAATLDAAAVAEHLQRDVDVVLPFDKSVLVSGNTGRPVALRSGKRLGFGKALQRLVGSVDEGVVQ